MEAPAPSGLSRRRKLLIAGAAVVLIALVVTIGVVVSGGSSQQPDPAQAIGHYSGPANHTATPSTTRTEIDTPGGRATDALNRAAAALLEGDEAGWLKAVAPGMPKVRAYYEDLYTSLRGLGVTQQVPGRVRRRGADDRAGPDHRRAEAARADERRRGIGPGLRHAVPAHRPGLPHLDQGSGLT